MSRTPAHDRKDTDPEAHIKNLHAEAGEGEGLESNWPCFSGARALPDHCPLPSQHPGSSQNPNSHISASAEASHCGNSTTRRQKLHAGMVPPRISQVLAAHYEGGLERAQVCIQAEVPASHDGLIGSMHGDPSEEPSGGSSVSSRPRVHAAHVVHQAAESPDVQARSERHSSLGRMIQIPRAIYVGVDVARWRICDARGATGTPRP